MFLEDDQRETDNEIEPMDNPQPLSQQTYFSQSASSMIPPPIPEFTAPIRADVPSYPASATIITPPLNMSSVAHSNTILPSAASQPILSPLSAPPLPLKPRNYPNPNYISKNDKFSALGANTWIPNYPIRGNPLPNYSPLYNTYNPQYNQINPSNTYNPLQQTTLVSGNQYNAYNALNYNNPISTTYTTTQIIPDYSNADLSYPVLISIFFSSCRTWRHL